jgi:DNA-directed RNA polymerase specialized sigma24 family protein
MRQFRFPKADFRNRQKNDAGALSWGRSGPCKLPRHSMTQLTELLGRIQAGGTQARDALFTVLRVHEALEALEQAQPRLAQVAQMRYFGGYNEQEIAETLDITERTLRRDWEKARLILAAALR